MWGKINAIKGKNKNKSVSSIKNKDNEIVDKEGEISNEIGKHFQNISNGENSSEAFKKHRRKDYTNIDFNTDTIKVIGC